MTETVTVAFPAAAGAVYSTFALPVLSPLSGLEVTSALPDDATTDIDLKPASITNCMSISRVPDVKTLSTNDSLTVIIGLSEGGGVSSSSPHDTIKPMLNNITKIPIRFNFFILI